MILPNPFPTCQQAIDAKASQLSANVGTVQSDFITDSGMGTIHKNYQWGAIYCHDVFTGAHAVYGDIYLKFQTVGWYGYPTSDETGATDADGMTVRYNTLSNGGAIYWSAQDGAHLIYGDIYQKWLSFDGLHNPTYGIPVTDEASADSVSRFNDFKYGGSIYWTATNGAHLIYGSIKTKWLATGGIHMMGHPITDEATAGDNFSRFNNFDNGGAIYWTPTNGACLIYGDIYKEWMSIGGVDSVVGYCITDETGSGTHGGRYNDFSNGMIYWHAGTSYVHVGPLPTSLDFNWNPIVFNNGAGVGGWADVTIYNNGNAHWGSHMHVSFAPYDVSIAYVLMDADGTSIGLSQHGTAGPNLGIFGSNDWDVDTTVNNAEIQENWRAFVAMTEWRARADTSFAFLTLIEDLYNDIKAIYPYAAAAISILA